MEKNREKIIKERDLIIEQIHKYVPIFSRFFDVQSTIREYSENLFNFEVSPVHIERQKLIKHKITEKFITLFGDKGFLELNIKFPNKLAFNIVDHHQVLNHPALIGSNVIGGINKILTNSKQAPTIVISSGDVPPNNYFSKSGFQFKNNTVPLFSVSERENCSYFMDKRKFNFIERLKITKRWQEFDCKEQDFLTQYQEIFNSIDFSLCKDYNDQITLIVKHTWPLMFEKSIRQNLPELLYITQEELTRECLKILLKENNFISAGLFNPTFRQKILDNFRGIVVAWKESDHKGTHFFWRKYPGQPRSLRMYVKGNMLVPDDERFKHLAIELNPDTIIELMQKREIYPSLFMIFSVLNFYAGIKPLTGYGSTVYLELFRQAWLKTLETSEFPEENELIKQVDATGFIGGIAIFFGKRDGRIKTLQATDIMAQGGITKDYLQKIFNMKFNELLSVASADLYDYFSSKYIPKEVKIKKQINFDDLANITFDCL